MIERRTWPIWLLTGLMTTIAILFGAFFLVWCGTLRFLFNDWGVQAIALLIGPATIAWLAFNAARSAWDGLPEAPTGAAGALVALQVFVGVIQADALLSGEAEGIGLWTVVPHVVLVALIGLCFWISPAFRYHRIEYAEPAPEAPYEHYDDDEDGMYLGGA